jgi:hypothetical protein
LFFLLKGAESAAVPTALQRGDGHKVPQTKVKELVAFDQLDQIATTLAVSPSGMSTGRLSPWQS